jgi:hypothetical protein
MARVWAEGEGEVMRLLDIGNAISAFVAAVFWFLSAKIGDRRRKFTVVRGGRS